MCISCRVRPNVFRMALALSGLAALSAGAAEPTIKDVLGFVPVQKDVEYDQPAANEIPQCTISVEKLGAASAFIARGAGGQVLRAFADTNNDNKVDQWSYFRNGIETYRDIDADYNEKAEQFRWLGTSGTRWGEDSNGDGQIDRWKQISAEEVAFEIFAAVRDRDTARFTRVMITPKELDALGMGDTMRQRAVERLQTAIKRFTEGAAKQQIVDARSVWIHFGASRPGVLPAGTNGTAQDITVYENVSAVVETQGKNAQFPIGTLVRIGDSWRVIDAPTAFEAATPEQNALAYTFFTPTLDREPAAPEPEEGEGLDAEAQKIANEIETLDKKLAEVKSAEERGEIYDQLAAKLRAAAASAKGATSQVTWIKQLAERLAIGAQTRDYPKGLEKLEQLHTELAGQAKEAELTGYVRFRLIMANYSVRTQEKDAPFDKIQDEWIEQLQDYVKLYPKGPDALDAMFQLAMAEEFAGEDDEAVEWYRKITQDPAESAIKVKAQGSLRRLESVGKPFELNSKMVDGRAINIKQLQGKLVLVHYWSASMDENYLKDLEEIDRSFVKYSKDFVPVGINLDRDPAQVIAAQKQLNIKWPQINEPTGIEGPLALQYGIPVVPTTFLIDGDGNVIDRNVSIARLDAILRKKFR